MGSRTSRSYLVKTLRVQYTAAMENRTYTFFRFALLFVGICVLGISLLAANRSITGGIKRMMTRKLYFGRPILPDHVLYEVTMAVDRLQFISTEPIQRVPLAVKYAEKRFQTGVLLFADGQAELAVTTLGKSQKYLFFAAEQVLATPSNYTTETREMVQNALEHSVYRLELTQEEHPCVETVELSNLIEQTHAFLQQFHALSSKN